MGVLDFLSAFVLGFLTPLTAVCVLPLYPAFLVFLSKKALQKKGILPQLGLLILGGVLLFMFLFGLLFTAFLKVSLSRVIGVVSPLAFGILAIISLLLIFNIQIWNYLPKVKTPLGDSPRLSAFLYGFFFGAIVIPCNPLFIAALFAQVLTSVDFFVGVLSFVFFGLGLGFPLVLFSLLSLKFSEQIIGFLTKNSRMIQLVSGIAMFLISLYYLIFVFRVIM